MAVQKRAEGLIQTQSRRVALVSRIHSMNTLHLNICVTTLEMSFAAVVCFYVSLENYQTHQR